MKYVASHMTVNLKLLGFVYEPPLEAVKDFKLDFLYP